MSSLHPDIVSTEGRHTDGHSHRHLLRLLAGRLIFHVFPGISVQCPDHNGADAVTVGMYSWSCPVMPCMALQNKLFPKNRKSLCKLLVPGTTLGQPRIPGCPSDVPHPRHSDSTKRQFLCAGLLLCTSRFENLVVKSQETPISLGLEDLSSVSHAAISDMPVNPSDRLSVCELLLKLLFWLTVWQ